MIKTLAAILFFIALNANAAAPVVDCTPSRTTGTAPLAVFLDCTATTGVTMHTGDFRVSFGDSVGGTWSYGANTAISKNGASGIVAAHLYTVAGTFTITTRVCNSSGECAQDTDIITVTAADTTYSSTTVCIAASGADFTGCPSGSATVTNSDFDAEWATQIAAGKRRLLYKRGDSFTASAATTITAAGPGLVGSFGSGAKPIIQMTGNTDIFIPNGAGDWVFMDLDLRGNSGASDRAFHPTNVATVRLTFFRNDISGVHNGWTLSDPSGTVWDQVFLFENNVTSITGTSGGYGAFISAKRFAAIGNNFNNAGGGEHNTRFPYLQKAVISSNTFEDVGAGGKANIKMHAPAFGTYAVETEYVIVSDNKLISNSPDNQIELHPQTSGAGTDERISNILLERNWFTVESGYNSPQLGVQATSVTIRNNLFIGTGNLNDIYVSVQQYASGTPAATGIAIYNNTGYRSDVSSLRGFFFTADVASGGVTAKNNLCYTPATTGSADCISDAATGTVKSNNTGDGGTSVTTNPSFDGPLTSPVGFRIATTSDYQNAGTAVFPASNSDFFNCDDTTANEHIGAFVPRVRASCKGVAQ